jgi:hypothetical protein
MVEHLTTLLDHATVVPAVNQIEVHPYFQQRDVQDFGAEHGIFTQAWSPIGGITFYRDGSHGSTLDDQLIADIATAHGKTSAQAMLRWGLQHGRSVIPKSTKPSRIAENINVFDSELSANEMVAIDGLGYRPSRRPRAGRNHPGGLRPRDPRGLRAVATVSAADRAAEQSAVQREKSRPVTESLDERGNHVEPPRRAATRSVSRALSGQRTTHTDRQRRPRAGPFHRSGTLNAQPRASSRTALRRERPRISARQLRLGQKEADADTERGSVPTFAVAP